MTGHPPGGSAEETSGNGREAWVVTVDMGYGHQRAAAPFRAIARGGIITANDHPAIGGDERRLWRIFQGAYEGLSRLGDIPLVGQPLWKLYDRFQRICDRYPWRDLSMPNPGAAQLDRLLRRGLGEGVARHAARESIPFLTTFFAPALAADRAGLRDVFCIATDTDINRIWVARDPARSRVRYGAPTAEARRRLLQYGVPEERVYLTGFPLPEENTADASGDLRRRLARLDPSRRLIERDRAALAGAVGEPGAPEGPVHLTYAVGGAGAQRGVASEILRSTARLVRDGSMRLTLVAGVRREVHAFFLAEIARAGLEPEFGRGVRVLVAPDKPTYFREFNRLLRSTDILWTKPGELVFFAALGIPLILTPPLGSHEEFNRDWIQTMGAGFSQLPPRHAAEWLWDWLDQGILAEAAFDGFRKAPRCGTRNILAALFAEDRDTLPRIMPGCSETT